MKEQTDFAAVYADIGAQIRALRVAAGLTQSQLCGTYITRNMLSRIENGAVHPSVDTLIYIANRLKVSPAYFLCLNDGEREQFKKSGRVKDARALFSSAGYEKCSQLLRGTKDPEEALILCISEGRLAVADIEKCALGAALTHLRAAREAALCTPLKDSLFAEIALLESFCRCLGGGDIPKPRDVLCAGSSIAGTSLHAFLFGAALYFDGCADISPAVSAVPAKSAYGMYLEACRLTLCKDYAAALGILDSARETAQSTLCRRFAMSLSEVCFRETGDFRRAYETANAVRELTESCKKQLSR